MVSEQHEHFRCAGITVLVLRYAFGSCFLSLCILGHSAKHAVCKHCIWFADGLGRNTVVSWLPAKHEYVPNLQHPPPPLALGCTVSRVANVGHVQRKLQTQTGKKVFALKGNERGVPAASPTTPQLPPPPCRGGGGGCPSRIELRRHPNVQYVHTPHHGFREVQPKSFGRSLQLSGGLQAQIVRSIHQKAEADHPYSWMYRAQPAVDTLATKSGSQ